MSYGLVVVSDTGTAIINGDSPSFEYFDAFVATSISGNVHTFVVDTGGWLPLCFLKITDGKAGGVLSSSQNGSQFTIEVLMDFTDNLYVFRVVNGAPTGFGLAAWGSNGVLIYDSHSVMLNAKKVALCGFARAASSDGFNMSLFNGGSVRPRSSVSYSDQYVGQIVQFRSWSTYDQYTYYTWENVPYQNFEYVDKWEYVNGFLVNNGSYQWVTRYRYENVAHTDYHWVFHNATDYYAIYAHVKKTDWHIDRSVVRRTGNSYQVEWMRHETGYYNEVVSGYGVYQYSTGYDSSAAGGSSYTNVTQLSGLGTDIASTIGVIISDSAGTYFTKDNTFPYADADYNVADTNILFINGADYV